MIKAVIMAGGEGTRLRPLTSNRPKPMIPVINKPVIEHTINLLKKQGITDIIISLFYRPESVQNYFADGSDWDVNITYSVEETPLGTAGGVKKAIGDCNDTFIVLSGDGVIDFNITKIFEYHKEKESQLTIVLKHVKEPIDYGIVIINDEGRIVKFFEKPAWSQVFSDTVNTGMYLLEPSILDHIPEGKSDFSMDIFPSLHEKDIPLYGYVSDGYWCDIGDLNSYRDAHLAILDGLVAIDFPGKKIGENVWAGKDVDISNDAVIKGPAILGDFVKIKKGAEVAEFCVIGDNIVVEENASVRRSIIYHGTIIGQKSELRGAIVGKRCVLEEAVSIYEGAVVSDDCQIGSGVEIPSGIRVWPDKVIEQGTKLTTDLIWGQREKKTLFSSEGIVGSFNIKITPEFAAKLGSALGAFLSKNSKVVISRDTTLASRLIKRGITSGLLSMGINVYDIEIESIPINRHTIRLLNADMGIYVQKSPFAGLQYIQIKIFDKNGFQISINDEKKIENIFFRGDYPRKDAFEVGSIFFPIHQIESYISNVKNYINFELLEKKKWNMIVDCFNGSASNVFPDLLASFGCQLTVFRGQEKEFASMEDVKNETRKTIDNIISMTKSNKEIGVIIGPHGEYITIVDEMGNILSNDDISAILCISYLKFKNEKIINIPVTSSMILDEIAYSYGGKVIRISSKIRSPENIDDIFLNNTAGRYPYLEKDYDPMITFLIILEFLALENITLYELKKKLPKSDIVRISIPCTVDEKAAIMRYLTINTDTSSKVEMIDGVRIIKDKAWVLILPDASQPLLHLYAESKDIKLRDQILEEYSLKIKKFKTSS